MATPKKIKVERKVSVYKRTTTTIDITLGMVLDALKQVYDIPENDVPHFVNDWTEGELAGSLTYPILRYHSEEVEDDDLKECD